MITQKYDVKYTLHGKISKSIFIIHYLHILWQEQMMKISTCPTWAH